MSTDSNITGRIRTERMSIGNNITNSICIFCVRAERVSIDSNITDSIAFVVSEQRG